MLNWLYDLLGSMLAWFESWTGSYALALLFYALIFKIVFLPFAVKQQKNQIKMAKLAPQIETIKAKYKGRNSREAQQQMQQEIMEFQQKEGYSPFAGCLPMLIQLPLIMWLYTVIRNPLSYIAKFADDIIVKANTIVNNLEADIAFKQIDQIDLVSKINDYTGKYGSADFEAIGLEVAKLPNFDLFGINLAETPGFGLIGTIDGWLILIPFLAAGFSWLSMFLMRIWNRNPAAAGADAQAQASNKMMDLMMPAMSLFISFGFSGMLGVYWIYQSIFSMLQSFILSKVMPMPVFTEEDIKAMKKAQREAEKAQKEALKAQPKYRSLHYIDEDDYEELPELKNQPAKAQKNANIDVPEIKD